MAGRRTHRTSSDLRRYTFLAHTILVLLVVLPAEAIDQKLVGLAQPAPATAVVNPSTTKKQPPKSSKKGATAHPPTKSPVHTKAIKKNANGISHGKSMKPSAGASKNNKHIPSKNTKINSLKGKGKKKIIDKRGKKSKISKTSKKSKAGSTKGNKAGKRIKKRKIRYYHKPSANVTRYLHNLTIQEEKKHALIVQNLTKVEKNLGQVEQRLDQLGMRNFRLTMRKQVHKLLDKLQYQGNVKIMIRRDPPKDPLDFRGEMRNAEDRSPIHHKMNSIMSKGNIPLKKLIHSLEPKVSKKSPTLKDRFSKRWKKDPKDPKAATNIPATKMKALSLSSDSPKPRPKRKLRGRRVHRRYRKGKLPRFYESDEDPSASKPSVKQAGTDKHKNSGKHNKKTANTSASKKKSPHKQIGKSAGSQSNKNPVVQKPTLVAA